MAESTAPNEEPGRSGVAPMAVAIEAELERFRRLSLHLWQAVAGAGLIAGVVLALTVSVEVGLVGVGVSAFYLAWTVPASWRLRTGAEVPRFASLAIDLVEASAPWTFLVAITLVQGAEYALASWVPPMVFCMVLLLSTIRLRVIAPAVLGTVAGILFPVLYFVLIAERVPEEFSSHLLYQAPMQISRGVSMIVCGVLGSFGARVLRAAIFRAEGRVRERDLFGKYRLMETIARGGMGEVIEALYCPEGGFERRVAIKRIHSHLAEKPRFVALFRAEAELSARLAHPNIVQVLDFGSVDDTFFLAMELVDGMTLGQFLGRSQGRAVKLPEHVVGLVTRAIGEGLHHAHNLALGTDAKPLRVVHRDLCPQNVLLSRNGEVKITDFGVARALKEAESSHTRHVVGHTAYMAPEQARDRAIDPRSDLFSLGVVVWEMLTTQRLFLRSTDAATLEALLNGDVPSVVPARPGVHPGWDEFLRRSLTQEPEERFGSAREMLTFLDEIPTSRKDGAGEELAALIALVAGDDPSADAPGESTDTVVERRHPPFGA